MEEINYLNNIFLSLTSNQKIGILFLILCTLSKRASIIQGEKASGKSHLIRAFAKLMGKELNIYQLNSKSSTSLLIGQAKLNSKITKEEYEKLKKIFLSLEKFELINNNINKSFKQKEYENWNAQSFKELIDLLAKEEKIRNIEEAAIIKKARFEISKMINRVNRFNNDYDSSFVISMKKGFWNLFDGIESAPLQLSEKISTLVGEEPELDLLEKGDESYFFTKKKKIYLILQ